MNIVQYHFTCVYSVKNCGNNTLHKIILYCFLFKVILLKKKKIFYK